MGSISEISFDGYSILENKNGFYNDVFNLLFNPDDYFEETRMRDQMVWENGWSESYQEYTFKGFRQTVGNCRQRLEIYGQSISKTTENFNKIIEVVDPESYYFPIQSVTYSMYRAALKNILDNGLSGDGSINTDLLNTLVSGELFFPKLETSDCIYCILDSLDDNAIVEYNLTDVINGGWVDLSEIMNFEIEKIIVLTEGITDAEFISKSLKLLNPHLFNYYHFVDFKGFKVEGGASAMVKMLKAFAASNVKHPVIGLFDNDAVGLLELSKLSNVKMPSNIRLVSLPYLEFASNYPVKISTDHALMNINGIACGIEMYLGSDLLSIDGSYRNVSLTIFNHPSSKYHGSLEDKSVVQDLFRAKLAASDMNGMEDMSMVLKGLFNAFLQT